MYVLRKRVRLFATALLFWEPDADFALSGLRRVGAVDDVFANSQCKVTTDGAWGCLGDWVGAASQLTPCVNCALAFDDASNQWCRSDEFYEFTEEWLIGVLFVVLLSGLAVCGAQVQLDELEALALDACDDVTDMAVCNAVWLNKDECTFSHASYRRRASSRLQFWGNENPTCYTTHRFTRVMLQALSRLFSRCEVNKAALG